MIILKNEGEIDIKVITTMGVNIKETDNPIGFFGTGLKYALAVLMREGISFDLFIGKNKFMFYVKEDVIRNQKVNLCQMLGTYDAIDLGFTTALGKNWELWQAYRELESNCRDEGGRVYEATGEPKGEPGYTKFVLYNMPDVGEVFLDKSKRKLLLRTKKIEIYEGESKVMFYRGIRAKDLDIPSQYTYNILQHCTLTEDRLLCFDYQVQEIISNAVAQMDNEEVIEKVITAPNEAYESRLHMDYSCNVPPGHKFIGAYRMHGKNTNHSIKSYVTQHTPKAPKTAKEKLTEFRQSIEDLCNSYGLQYEIDIDGYITILAHELFKEAQ